LDFPALVGVGIAAFVSTKIDDLFILMVFFATPRFPSSQIVLGQYIGIGSLIGVSLAGSLIALVLPHNLIGLIGLFPVAIATKELVDLHKKKAMRKMMRKFRSIGGRVLPYVLIGLGIYILVEAFLMV
jgi:cadmium resistance protein CadD (predicted permease)